MDGNEKNADLTPAASTTEFHRRVKALALFLSDYAAELFAVGATSARVTMNVNRMASRYGLSADMAILSRHIIMTVTDDASGHTYSTVSRARHRPISFDRNTTLSRLSWRVCDENLSLGEARMMMDEILRQPYGDTRFILLMASLANMSFCFLFGGDAWAMGAVFVATALGYLVKVGLLHAGFDVRAVFALSAFCATLVGCTCHVFKLGDTPEVAMGTSVLFLVPGIPFINSISDLIHGHYICFFSRLTNACILTICLSAGFIVGLLVMGLGNA